MAYKQSGFPMHSGVSPMKKVGEGLKQAMKEKGTKAGKDTRTDGQKAKDKRELDRQNKIQKNFQNTAAHTRRRHKNSLYELGYYQDEGKMVHPFGKGDKMDKAKWEKWKSKGENKPYKGETKGLIK